MESGKNGLAHFIRKSLHIFLSIYEISVARSFVFELKLKFESVVKDAATGTNDATDWLNSSNFIHLLTVCQHFGRSGCCSPLCPPSSSIIIQLWLWPQLLAQTARLPDYQTTIHIHYYSRAPAKGGLGYQNNEL